MIGNDRLNTFNRLNESDVYSFDDVRSLDSIVVCRLVDLLVEAEEFLILFEDLLISFVIHLLLFLESGSEHV